MPGTDTREEQQRGRLSSLLFWAGVGLAPLAAVLLLMVSGDAKLRAAIGVLTLSVILIGLSVTMRRDNDTMRVELEDMVFDEIDGVRADVRDDIATAAHATHRAFAEKMQYVMEQLQATRAELDSTRAQLEALRADPMRHAMSPVGAGAGTRHAAGVPAGAHHGQAHQPSAGGRPGVVRHTETVQVTTRHTVVDPHSEDSRGAVYQSVPVGGYDRGSRQDDADYAPPRAEPRPARPEREESWTEQRIREQLARRAEEEASRHSVAVEPEAPWAGRSARGADDRWSERGEGSWPGVSAGDRWATVRDDERGRELRMGERRVATHRDESGAELRIEDRWAAVRREAARGGFKWRDDANADDLGGGFAWQESGRDERAAISGSDREPRWSGYSAEHSANYEDEREHDRRYR